MVRQVLVAVGDHRAALVPAAAPDDVHGLCGEGVRGAHDRADVEVVLPVLDGDVERMPARVEVGDDRVHAPVPIAIDDVARVAVLEQLGVVARIVGPRCSTAGPRADALRHRRLGVLGLGARRVGLVGHAATLPGTETAPAQDAGAESCRRSRSYPSNSTLPRQATPGDGDERLAAGAHDLPIALDVPCALSSSNPAGCSRSRRARPARRTRRPSSPCAHPGWARPCRWSRRRMRRQRRLPRRVRVRRCSR